MSMFLPRETMSLEICISCALLTANGESSHYDDLDDAERARVDAAIEQFYSSAPRVECVSVEGEDQFFSGRSCPMCGDVLAGDRIDATALLAPRVNLRKIWHDRADRARGVARTARALERDLAAVGGAAREWLEGREGVKPRLARETARGIERVSARPSTVDATHAIVLEDRLDCSTLDASVAPLEGEPNLRRLTLDFGEDHFVALDLSRDDLLALAALALDAALSVERS